MGPLVQDAFDSFVLWLPQSIAGPLVEFLYLFVELGHRVVDIAERAAEVFGVYVYN
jgi:hypothetical protein